MVSLSTAIARRRVFYPRPTLAMPDILMIDIPDEFRVPGLLLGHYRPIIMETIAEQDEVEFRLEEEREVSGLPDLLDTRPSTFAAGHITVAHYGPPVDDWPYALLCRWPPELVAATPKELRMFIRGAYTIELFADREQLERTSNRLLALLKRHRRARVEIIMPDWSAVPGKPRH